MIYNLIQTPSIACYAYQTLNLLMRCDMTLDQTYVQNIIQYNIKRASQLYTNKDLLKQVTLFYASVINKYPQDIFAILERANTSMYKVLS